MAFKGYKVFVCGTSSATTAHLSADGLITLCGKEIRQTVNWGELESGGFDPKWDCRGCLNSCEAAEKQQNFISE